MSAAIPVRAIDHLNLQVRDLAESIAFYARVFGFDVKEDHRDDASPWAIVGRAGAAYLALYEDRDADPAGQAGMNHWCFVVDDAEDTLARLRLLGVEPRTWAGTAIVTWPRSRSVYINDPTGYEIELSDRFGGALDPLPGAA